MKRHVLTIIACLSFGVFAPLYAQDVTITNNDISRPMAWRGGPYQIKNLLEIKAGRQFIIRANRFSNNWVAAQSGLSILFTVRNERPWTTVEDILFEGNTLRNASGGIIAAMRSGRKSN